MTKNKKSSYPPNMRNYLDAPLNTPESKSELDSVKLPDNVEDDIVVNNISNAEFDYTFNCGADIPTTEDDEYF
ncbi:hypothetical protein ACQPVY_02980 [Clostridium ihumii]